MTHWVRVLSSCNKDHQLGILRSAKQRGKRDQKIRDFINKIRRHGVAMISRLLKIIVSFAEYRLFYRALLQKRPMIVSFAEYRLFYRDLLTYEEPANRSHPIQKSL